MPEAPTSKNKRGGLIETEPGEAPRREARCVIITLLLNQSSDRPERG